MKEQRKDERDVLAADRANKLCVERAQDTDIPVDFSAITLKAELHDDGTSWASRDFKYVRDDAKVKGN